MSAPLPRTAAHTIPGQSGGKEGQGAALHVECTALGCPAGAALAALAAVAATAALAAVAAIASIAAIAALVSAQPTFPRCSHHGWPTRQTTRAARAAVRARASETSQSSSRVIAARRRRHQCNRSRRQIDAAAAGVSPSPARAAVAALGTVGAIGAIAAVAEVSAIASCASRNACGRRTTDSPSTSCSPLPPGSASPAHNAVPTIAATPAETSGCRVVIDGTGAGKSQRAIGDIDAAAGRSAAVAAVAASTQVQNRADAAQFAQYGKKGFQGVGNIGNVASETGDFIYIFFQLVGEQSDQTQDTSRPILAFLAIRPIPARCSGCHWTVTIGARLTVVAVQTVQNQIGKPKRGAAVAARTTLGVIVTHGAVDESERAGGQVNAAALGILALAAFSAIDALVTEEARLAIVPHRSIAVYADIAQRYLAAVDQHASTQGRVAAQDAAIHGAAVLDDNVLELDGHVVADDLDDPVVPGAIACSEDRL